MAGNRSHEYKVILRKFDNEKDVLPAYTTRQLMFGGRHITHAPDYKPKFAAPETLGPTNRGKRSTERALISFKANFETIKAMLIENIGNVKIAGALGISKRTLVDQIARSDELKELSAKRRVANSSAKIKLLNDKRKINGNSNT